MQPLSPLTYLWRHRGQTLLLVCLIILVTCGVSLSVGMVQPIVEHLSVLAMGHLEHFSVVSPSDGLSPGADIASRLRTHPDVAHVFPDNGAGLTMMVPSFEASSVSRLWGLTEGDTQMALELCHLRLREGRLPEPHRAEIVLSKEIANPLGLQVGDEISRVVDERYYYDIREPLTLVGILESDPSVRGARPVPLAILSYDYLQGHGAYAPRPTSLLVFPQDGRRSAVNDFLETSVPSRQAQVMTFEKGERLIGDVRRVTDIMFVVVDSLVATVVALVAGMLNWTALTRRLTDLGLFQAVGYQRGRLVRGITLETAAVVLVGWIAGLAASWLLLAWLRVGVYQPKGLELDLSNLKPLWFAVPIPLAVIGFALCNVARILSRLDPVETIERGGRVAEEPTYRKVARSGKPLSSLTYYRRHPRRAASMVVLLGLVILGVAFPALLFSPTLDVQEPFYLNHLVYVSEFSPGLGLAADTGLVGQIRAHPAVERVVPVRPLSLGISIPPATLLQASVYGVYEDDLLYLVDLFGLRLDQGRFPLARSNEIILSRALALNRDLHVGDSVGHPVNERDANLPTELVVVGIFSGEIETGFLSAEYMESHELYGAVPVNLFLVPSEGHKAEMDEWLLESASRSGDRVTTYDELASETRQAKRGMMLLFAAIESIVALVAAAAMAALNHIFISQRQDEFGVLHAAGLSRRWLVKRAFGETVSVVVLAWVLGAGLCLAGLVLSQAAMYGPLGLRVDIADPTPWLFTLPIPLAVIGVSMGTVIRMLTRLDPVSIVERR